MDRNSANHGPKLLFKKGQFKHQFCNKKTLIQCEEISKIHDRKCRLEAARQRRHAIGELDKITKNKNVNWLKFSKKIEITNVVSTPCSRDSNCQKGTDASLHASYCQYLCERRKAATRGNENRQSSLHWFVRESHAKSSSEDSDGQYLSRRNGRMISLVSLGIG